MKFVKNQHKRGVNRERRKLLDFVGKAGISSAILRSSPLALSALTTRYAEAATGTGKRVVFMYLGDGSPPGHWLPRSSSNMNTATAPYGSGGPGVNGYNVAKYCHFYEVNNSWNEHGQTFKCMGERNFHAGQYANTMDTLLAKRNFFPSQFDIVRVAVQKKQVGFSIEDGEAASFIDGPRKAFNDLFSGVAVSNTDNTYKKVFEMNARAIESIKTKIGSDERERLDVHLATLEKIEKDLASAADSGSDSKACEAKQPGSPENFIDECMQTCDVMIAALKCGLTNVTSIMLSDNQAEWEIPSAVRPQLKLPVGSPQTYHSSNHSIDQIGHEGIGKFMSVISQVPAYFISKLASETASGEGSPLINSTLFVQINDMGFGDHSAAGAPWILASGNNYGAGAPWILASGNNYGVNGFGRGGYGTNKQLLQSIPSRMGLDGALAGKY